MVIVQMQQTVRTPDDPLIDNHLSNRLEILINEIFLNLFSETIEKDAKSLTPENCDCDIIDYNAIRIIQKNSRKATYNYFIHF